MHNIASMLDSLGIGNQINIGGNMMPHTGINITLNGHQVPTNQHHYQQHTVHYGDSGDDEGGEYYEEEDGDHDHDELLEDEEEQVDEDGQPLLSPNEIKNLINSIPSFKFENQ